MGSSPFAFELPPDRIAQHPATERDGARLLVLRRGSSEGLAHRRIIDLPDILREGDLLVVNRSRVFPARLRAERETGGRVELLLLAETGEPGVWRTMARPMRRLHPGQTLRLRARDGSEAGSVSIVGRTPGTLDVAFAPGRDVVGLAERIGETPLPPYILRPDGPTPADRARYQTVFAREPGSVAAPTAGLHLSERILGRLRERGMRVAEVLLHVGPATFLAGQPGREALAVEPERFEVPAEARSLIEETRGRGRVIAIGTTTTRALESAARQGWPEGLQTTDLVLAPGEEFRAIDALLTNFHLPGSSLLSLVCGFAGVRPTELAYREALGAGYRFYSYGDAMLVLP